MSSLGNLTALCINTPMSVCNLLPETTTQLLVPACITKSVVINGVMVDNAANVFINILVVLMILFLLYFVSGKVAAVGRIEMSVFFFVYLVTVVFQSLVAGNLIGGLDNGIVFMSAIHVGLIATVFWMLVINGFVGFQWMRDGTCGSLTLYLVSSFAVFFGIGFIALDMRNNYTALSFNIQSNIIFVAYLIWPMAAVLIYTVQSVVLVYQRLDTQKPLMWVFLALIAFAAAQVLSFAVNSNICLGLGTSVDGNLFSAFLVFLSAALVFTFFDSIMEDEYADYDCDVRV